MKVLVAAYGILQPKSIGLALGLQQGDIITAINNIPSTTTDSRFEIYQAVVNMKLGDTITLGITRNNRPVELRYTLQTIEKTAATPGKEALAYQLNLQNRWKLNE